jgi:ABC-2 type transport system permease protein
MISLLVMNLATSLMLGATWGPTIGVLMLGAATIFAFMGVSAIGASFARTEEAAQGFVGITMSLFALLGGNFIPINEAPLLVQRLSLGTPNGWALRGYIDLSTGGGLSSITTPLIALAVIGTLTFSIGALRGRRLLIK